MHPQSRPKNPAGVGWRRQRLPALVALGLPLLAAGTVLAAEPPSPAPCPPGSHDVDCKPVPRSATPPDAQPTPDGRSGSTAADPDLSDTLSQSRGVVTPPPTGDTEIRRPVPSEGVGKTPVIPPPGSPGGDPTVVPK